MEQAILFQRYRMKSNRIKEAQTDYQIVLAKQNQLEKRQREIQDRIDIEQAKIENCKLSSIEGRKTYQDALKKVAIGESADSDLLQIKEANKRNEAQIEVSEDIVNSLLEQLGLVGKELGRAHERLYKKRNNLWKTVQSEAQNDFLTKYSKEIYDFLAISKLAGSIPSPGLFVPTIDTELLNRSLQTVEKAYL